MAGLAPRTIQALAGHVSISMRSVAIELDRNAGVE
jgi:hypothetical protein